MRLPIFDYFLTACGRDYCMIELDIAAVVREHNAKKVFHKKVAGCEGWTAAIFFFSSTVMEARKIEEELRRDHPEYHVAIRRLPQEVPASISYAIKLVTLATIDFSPQDQQTAAADVIQALKACGLSKHEMPAKQQTVSAAGHSKVRIRVLAFIEGTHTANDIQKQLSSRLPLGFGVVVNLGWLGFGSGACHLAAAHFYVDGRVEFVPDYPIHLMAPPCKKWWKMAG